MSAKFLVIEDFPANLELLRVLLEAFGHKVDPAEDGYAGLAAARAAKPDVVICDLQMDGIDGFEVARELRADAGLRDVPLIAVSAVVADGVEQQVLSSGFDAYISKPIEARRFVPLVERFLPQDMRRAPPLA